MSSTTENVSSIESEKETVKNTDSLFKFGNGTTTDFKFGCTLPISFGPFGTNNASDVQEERNISTDSTTNLNV